LFFIPLHLIFEVAFNSFAKHKENGIDVLICDEAHRIRKTSENMYTPKSARIGEPQIDELIRSSKLSVFFLDERQIVRPNEIGSINLIKNSAQKFGAEIYEMPELQTQFRCGGSGEYLSWIEKILQIKEEGDNIDLRDDNKMEFKIVEAPPNIKGNTAQGGTKIATIESGAQVSVPLFLETGDIIRVNTQSGEYVERVSKQ